MIIKVTKYGIIHAYAECNSCSWDDSVKIEELYGMQNLRNRIYTHVRKTGHKVTLEIGNSTDYYLTEEK